ncbi:MAG: serine/threonine-protein kinase [Deltaproteobacteria bacterium]
MRGAVFNHYEIWGKISAGGMSNVWLARHAELALPVIIKTLIPGGHVEPFEGRYRRLLNEARLTARLTSPRVVRVIDVGVYTPPQHELESLPFLVEEYVDGIDLAEFDRRRRTALRRPLPLWAVADQIAQAAEGLHAAHQAGVVHCDVKPSNLFGHGHAQIKVGDFGVAVASAGESVAPAGTPQFMSPEQLLQEPIARRSDVYSLGATAFTLRYGYPPFETPFDATRPDASPRFPAAGSPEEAYFQHVVAKMMARREDARYANMMIARYHMRALAQATITRLAPVRVSPSVFEIGRARVSFEVGDLTQVETDAIVNSTTSTMQMRMSLSNALRERGGDEIEAEAMAGGEHALGDCVVTGAGRLAAKALMHVVGGWQEVSCVARATHRALLLAEERQFTRIAMPAIATGGSGVSMESSADSMVGVLQQHLTLGGSRLREVRFVLYDARAHKRFLEVATGMLLGSEDAFQFDDGLDGVPTSDEASSAPTMFVARTSSTRPAT